MRQLGGHPPEAPPGETDVEQSSEIRPHERRVEEARQPVEVHRIERNPTETKPPEPVERLRITEVGDTYRDQPAKSEGPQTHPDSNARGETAAATTHVPDPRKRHEAEERELVEVYRIEPKPIPMEPSVPSPTQERKAAERRGSPLSDSLNPRIHEPNMLEAMEAIEADRTKQHPIETEPFKPPQEKEAGEVATTRPTPSPDHRSSVPEEAPHAVAPIGRWEEFHEPRIPEPTRGRPNLELVPLRQGAPSRLLTADLEREPRSSFLTLVVPTIAALLVVGALLWSAYRVRRQDAAMSTLKMENQKLTEMLAQMGEELKTPVAPSSGADKTTADKTATPQQTAIPTAKPPQSGQAAAPPSQRDGKAAGQPEGRAESEKQGNRQGVAVPPPVQGKERASARQKGSLYEHPPEIVPPYPTIYKPENATANAANSQTVPSAGAYREPFVPGAPQQTVPAPASARPATSAVTAPRVSAPPPSTATQTQTPVASNTNNSPTSNSEDATKNDAGIGSRANLLAQNIEAVQGLQRHSPVQLREFHARAGTPTLATPNVRLSVEHPDQGRGSYGLMVNQGGSSQQLRGAVNQPLVFTDAATHRDYALVVLSIADQQVYGYVRATR